MDKNDNSNHHAFGKPVTAYEEWNDPIPTATFGDMPIELGDLIRRELNEKDLRSLRLVCRQSQKDTVDYERRCYRVENILRVFFPDPDFIAKFRKIQHVTGALISGSQALSFFNREQYQDSDLDIFVKWDRLTPLHLLLTSTGYDYQPQEHTRNNGQMSYQAVTFTDACGLQAMTQFQNDKDESSRPYHNDAIYGVFDFWNQQISKKVQVVACASAEKMESIWNKWRDRGYEYVLTAAAHEALDVKSDQFTGCRYVGDKGCRVIALQPTYCDTNYDAVFCHSWNVGYLSKHHIDLQFATLTSPVLERQYNLSVEVFSTVKGHPCFKNIPAKRTSDCELVIIALQTFMMNRAPYMDYYLH
ncbi:hypothetical protein MPER_13245 [Moniliophthora perniciosa FA553]|nr:hypothetical protein MPER_13245 [Moniliophthora perniciosa FA553]